MGYAEESMITRQWGVLPPVFDEVFKELAKARATHAPMNSHHEGYAVILEETATENQSLREQKRLRMRKEAIQVAAMAVRFIEDVCDKD